MFGAWARMGVGVGLLCRIAVGSACVLFLRAVPCPVPVQLLLSLLPHPTRYFVV